MSLRRILIVGGSTRAAADSVRRAGWKPVCADLFADLDLKKTAEVIPVRNYPNSLPEDVAHVRAEGWFYCGALENHPRILERLLTMHSAIGPLLGTSPCALKFVRDPFWLTKTLRLAGLMSLDVAGESAPPAPDCSWLQKPLASAGGRAIRIWDEAACRIPIQEPHYFQRRVDGIGLSAIFRFENKQLEWLGAASELDENSISNAPSPFSYCGSVGPLKRIPMHCPNRRFRLWNRFHHKQRFADDQKRGKVVVLGSAVYQGTLQRKLTRIAKTIAQNVPGLQGLVGLDFRLDGENVWLTEVNPRYTASIELLEFATGRSMLNPDAPAFNESRRNLISKQIIYASDRLTAPDLSRFLTSENAWELPLMADIPVPGTVVEPGWPICTVFAEGWSIGAVQSLMRERVGGVCSALGLKSRKGGSGGKEVGEEGRR